MDCSDRVRLVKPYASLPAGSECVLLMKVLDGRDEFYVVHHPSFIFPMSVPVHFFMEV